MFTDRLEKIAGRIEGLQALALVAKDGIPVESVSPGTDLDLEVLVAELMAQVRAISQNHTELSVGQVQHFAVSTDRVGFMISAVSSDYFLLAVLGLSASLGRARFELRRAALLFEKDII